MDRKDFLKATSLLAGGALLSPQSLLAQDPWLIELLAKLAEAIIMDVFLKPIEELIKELVGMNDENKDEIYRRNEAYRDKQMYPSNVVAVGSNSFLYPVKSVSNYNKSGKYDVPMYSLNSNGLYENVATFQKNEIDGVSQAARKILNQNGASKSANTEMFLPVNEIYRDKSSKIRSSSYYNREKGIVEIRFGISNKWGFINIDSNSFRGQIPFSFLV